MIGAQILGILLISVIYLPPSDCACDISTLSTLNPPSGLIHDLSAGDTVANANVLPLRCDAAANEYINPNPANDYVFRYTE